MRRCAVAVALGAAGFLAPSAAQAQAPPDGAARAEALFNAAKQLRDAGLYAEACPNFAESKRLAPGVGVTLYLADCYEHTGKTASAWKEFKEAQQLASQRGDARAELARVHAQALEAKLSGLTIVVPHAASQEAPQVLLDGTPIPPEEWNVAMAVDPGDHVVTVNARNRPARTYPAHVDAGVRTASVRVEDAEASAPQPPSGAPTTLAATAPPAPESSDAAPATGKRVLGLVLLGAGVVGLGLGTAFLVKYESTANPPPQCNPPGKDHDAQIASGISFAAGGVALASALAVLLSAHGPSTPTTGLVVAPAPLNGGGGAFLQGRF